MQDWGIVECSVKCLKNKGVEMWEMTGGVKGIMW